MNDMFNVLILTSSKQCFDLWMVLNPLCRHGYKRKNLKNLRAKMQAAEELGSTLATVGQP